MKTQINKKFDIEQPIELVWKSLANPEEIVTCVPGASITDKLDERNFKGQVITKFGPIKASYSGDIEILELDEANRKMVLKGRGLDSKGKGSADMMMNGTLSEVDGKTHVDFNMDITIIGMLAQFGSRLINDVSDQLLDQFVNNFRKKLEKEAPTMETTAVAEESTAVKDQSSTEKVAEKMGKAKEQATEKMGEAKEQVTEKMGKAKEQVTEKMSEAKEQMTSKVEQVGGKVSEKANQLKEGVGGKLGEAGDKVSEKANQLKEGIGGKVEQAGQTMGVMGDKVAAKAGTAKESLSAKVEQVGDKMSNKTAQIKEQIAPKVEQAKESVKKKVAATPEPEEDNAFNGLSLVSTVIKSIFRSILDFFKSLFGGGKK